MWQFIEILTCFTPGYSWKMISRFFELATKHSPNSVGSCEHTFVLNRGSAILASGPAKSSYGSSNDWAIAIANFALLCGEGFVGGPRGGFVSRPDCKTRTHVVGAINVNEYARFQGPTGSLTIVTARALVVHRALVGTR